MSLRSNLKESYSPLFFLASLGNGGMAITFFIYLMFMVPHPDTPVVTFDAILPLVTGNNYLVAGLILLAVAGMLVFALRHFWTLGWNIREYMQYKKTPAYTQLVQSNAEVSLMAIPLTLAMTINVLFALGAVLVPNLWSFVEYIFPLPLIGFTLIGLYALRIFGNFFTRVLAHGNFDCARNNNLSQMLAIFAFAMIGVGLAAPAAMSDIKVTAALGAFGSIFFVSAAVLLGIIHFVLGFRAMMEHGVNQETSASLWIIIPILTLWGITFVRLSHSFHNHFGSHSEPVTLFILLSAFVSIQILFGGLGYFVMKHVGYYEEFVQGSGRSPGSYALICPGVAFFVLGMFFIHPGLVSNGVVDKLSIPYFVLMLPLVYIQVKTIRVMLKLDRKLLQTPPAEEQGMAAA
jgi:hypothetical protein